MSAKWERSRAWGRRRLTGPLSPLRWALDALSSIPFAMCMLGVVALWGVLGTIPIGWTGLAGAVLPEGALLRHHPAFDLTEGEWYRLWPFRAALALFVLNMIVATIRRIEFRWLNLGVLSVHAGIVLFAIGGWTYAALKREGVMLLPITDGGVYEEREVSWFSDMTQPAVLVRRDGEPDRVTPLEGLARFHSSQAEQEFTAGGYTIRVEMYRPLVWLGYQVVPSDIAKDSKPHPVWEIEITDLGVSVPGHEEVRRTTTLERPYFASPPSGGLRILATLHDHDEWEEWIRYYDLSHAIHGELHTSESLLFLKRDEALIVTPDSPPQRIMDIKAGGVLRIGDRYKVRLLHFFPYVRWVQKVESMEGDLTERYGRLEHSAIRLSYTDADGDPNAIWTPFTEFGDEVAAIDAETKLAFTLVRHGLKDASVRATDFTIIPRRKLSNEPADFIVSVAIADIRGESEQTIRLNQPATLRASPESERIIDRCASWLGSTRYSLSVSGWDDAGWTQGQARYVVLTVGNTPGTDLVAVGAALFALGTPWAFFVKPWVLRRRAASSGIDPTSQSAGPTHA